MYLIPSLLGLVSCQIAMHIAKPKGVGYDILLDLYILGLNM
jgi:hypothetical protein